MLSACVQAQTDGVSIDLSASGLSSLRYQGKEYLGHGDFRLNAATFQISTGAVQGSTNGACTLKEDKRQLLCSYAWGSIASTYSVSENRLILSITDEEPYRKSADGTFPRTARHQISREAGGI